MFCSVGKLFASAQSVKKDGLIVGDDMNEEHSKLIAQVLVRAPRVDG